MKVKKVLSLALSFVLALSVLAGCGSKKTEAKLVVNLVSEPEKLNTLLATDAPAGDVNRHIMTNLVMLDEHDNVIPGDKPGAGVAESWEISEDGLTYVFKLREGMKWTNGDPVTAHDFEYAWKALLNPETGAKYAYFAYVLKNGQAYNSGEDGVTADDVGVKATDDYTLEVVLESPTAYALSSFSFPSFTPVNQKFFEKVGLDTYMSSTDEETFCTNGPYTMDTWKHGDEIVLKKNKDYYAADQMAFIEEINFKMIGDANTWMNSYRAGELDVTTINGEQKDILSAEGLKLNTFMDGASAYLQFNFERDGVKNQKIRKAIALAVDNDEFVKAVQKNDSVPATSFTPPGVQGLEKPFYEEVGELIPIHANPEEAKKLFAEGLKEENMTAEDFVKKVTLIGDDSSKALVSLSVVQEQIRKNLGIEIQVESMPFKSRIAAMHEGEFSIAFALWGPDYNDPNTFLDMFETGGGNNQGKFSNATYDEKLNQARIEPDLAKRMQLLIDLEKIVCEEVVVAPIYWRSVDYIVSERVEGVRRTMLQNFNLLFAKIADK